MLVLIFRNVMSVRLVYITSILQESRSGFKIQYHKILSPDFKIGQLYLINTRRNLAKNIYQMIEHKVCDSSTETRLGKIPQHRKANRQVF